MTSHIEQLTPIVRARLHETLRPGKNVRGGTSSSQDDLIPVPITIKTVPIGMKNPKLEAWAGRTWSQFALVEMTSVLGSQGVTGSS